MKNVNTVVGKPYAVTTSTECTVMTPEGVVIVSCVPGQQVVFVAPCDVVLVSADEARLTETFSAAASTVSGGGFMKALEESVEQNAAQAEQALAELGSSLSAAMAEHERSSLLHLQDGERERWNAPIPPGVIFPSACAAMEGYLLCDGQAVSRADYAALYAAIGEAYGAGDGESTFNLPDLRARTLWGANDQHPLGQALEAGLPNVVGSLTSFGASVHQTIASTGCIVLSNTHNFLSGNSVNFSTGRQLDIDASLSNAIYGASDTVQPPALVVNFFIKY